MESLTPDELCSYLNVIRSPSKVVDVGFIFGTPRPEPAIIAAQLFHTGKILNVLVTGGMSHLTSSGQTEAEFHKDILLKQGVPLHRIFMEHRSSNTLENVLFGRQVLMSDLPQIQSLVAICRWFHSRRVLMTLKRHMPKIECFTNLYDSPLDVRGNFCTKQIEKAQLEYRKIPVYLAKGDLAELEEPLVGAQ
jgi:uncharacterized SAM-binding protein YcdF (DUF218 family)